MPRGRPKKHIYIKAVIEPGQTIFANNIHVTNYGTTKCDVLVKGTAQKILPHLVYDETETNRQSEDPQKVP